MRSSRELILPIFAIVTSLLGAWFASSIAASLKMPIGLILLAGFIFLPILPIIWVVYQEGRIRRIWKYRIPFLTYRISWRVLTINLGLITTLLIVYPQFALNALRQHGDGILGDLQGERIETVRTTLRQVANETADSLEQVRNQVSETISLYAPVLDLDIRDATIAEQTQWPWQGTGIHPAIKNMPSSIETSIPTVANYIATAESDPIQRLKALHDYVVTRIEYDAPAFFSNNIPDQSPNRVFQTRKAVCQGYADLLTALGKAIGLEIVTLDGYGRTAFSNDSFERNHAWNAVNLEGQWYLVDATWDSGNLNESGVWQQQYKTDYLMLPPEVMIHNHFPSDSTWQLLDRPFTFTEFQQLPDLDPRFFAEGLRLINPVQHQTQVEGRAKIELENPNHRYLLADYIQKGSSQTGKCNSGQATTGNTISCHFHHSGRYEVRLYSASFPYGQSYLSIGKLEFDFRT